ncbi:MAG: Glutamine--fructose-6-phosphate aminotransferase (isomerizing) [Actinobacteria bacterium ADurb.Bin346]|nr:MAG: Glutamine--fructose-6-phosphate aminotransferase (isomerizing) [Actinobacteria bacterium ADurb.Bin346]
MCGIVAYIGNRQCRKILLDGLKRLEYRGYDSAGIGILVHDNAMQTSGSNNGSKAAISIVKEAGKISELEAKLDGNGLDGTTGIGHTRWATHGVPNQANSHPHTDCSGEIAVVHNGIIENYAEIKEDLSAKGHIFLSETDTEVLPHLLEDYMKNETGGDLLIAMQKLLRKIRGSGAIVVMSASSQDELIAGRIASPLIVGISKEGNFFASDMPAVLEHTHNFIVINDFETVRITKDSVEIYDIDGNTLHREPFKVNWSMESAEKSGYEDFMLKEMFEQPYGIRETMRGRLSGSELNFDEINLSDTQIKKLKKIQIIACGTSYHAALTGKLIIEKWAKIPVEVDIGSEYRYRDPIIDENVLFIAITQSGETIDTLAAIKEARLKGAKVLAITNIVGSTAARESDSVVYTHAGPEIGVCATKTFTAQLMVMYLIGLYLARARGAMDNSMFSKILNELDIIPNKVQKILNNAPKIKRIADETYRYTCFLFLGRIFGFPMALEGALKLKEISYIHAEGYAAGEMKHGPIALTDTKTVVVGVIPRDHVYEKMLSNLQEVKARHARLFALVTEGDSNTGKYADYIFELPNTIEELYGILAVVPLQLYAYYIAKNHGRNVDQPRNLAKSVTVE